MESLFKRLVGGKAVNYMAVLGVTALLTGTVVGCGQSTTGSSQNMTESSNVSNSMSGSSNDSIFNSTSNGM